jgi:2-keto-3-deoxy-L-rhamnonate aldolase RhmA
MVRVAACERHLVTGMLDAGAMGIMVPMVETAAQAEQLASWCRFPPQGTRGVAFGVSHDDYTDKRHGKIMGGVSVSRNHETVFEEGFRCLLLGSDVQMFKNALRLLIARS